MTGRDAQGRMDAVARSEGDVPLPGAPRAPLAGSWASRLAALPDRTVLLIILGIALTLRLGVWFAFPAVLHPDEIYQIKEQAYRLLSGDGIIPWEFHAGARGWLWPLVLAGFATPAYHLVGTPYAFELSVAVAAILLSLIAVAAAYALGRRLSRAHALAAGLVIAVWYEAAFFAPHPLNEAAAANFLLLACACLFGGERAEGGGGRRYLVAGIACGLTFVLRTQLTPGLAVIALIGCGLDIRRRWLPLIAGALVPLILYGLVDWAMLGTPFKSIYAYYAANLAEGRASVFGTRPLALYLLMFLAEWRVLVVIPIVLLALSWRTPYRPLLLVGLAILLFHSLIPHKEFRFVYPALLCFAVVYALQSVDVAAALIARLARVPRAAAIRGAAAMAVVVWAVLSLVLAVRSPYWTEVHGDADWRQLTEELRQRPGLCGVGLYGMAWYQFPGRASLHRPIPLYPDHLPGEAADPALAKAYDAIVFPSTVIPPAGFGTAHCFAPAPGVGTPTYCLATRSGTCEPMPERELNRWLAENCVDFSDPAMPKRCSFGQ